MTQLHLRLRPSDAATIHDLQKRLSTPLRPNVTSSEVMRAALLSLQERLDAEAHA